MSEFPVFFKTMPQVQERDNIRDEQLLIPVCLMTTSPVSNTNQPATVALSNARQINVPSNVMQVISGQEQQQQLQHGNTQCEIKETASSMRPLQSMTTPIVTATPSCSYSTPQYAYLETRPYTQQVTLPQSTTLLNEIYESHPVYICSNADNNINNNNQNCALQMYTPAINAPLANQSNCIVASNAELNISDLNHNEVLIANQQQEQYCFSYLVENKFITQEQNDNIHNNQLTPQYNSPETNTTYTPMLQFTNANCSGGDSNNNINELSNISKSRNDNTYSVYYDNCAKTGMECKSVFVAPSTSPFTNSMTLISPQTTVQVQNEPAAVVNINDINAHPLYYTIDASHYSTENNINVESTGKNVSLPVLQLPLNASCLPQTETLANNYSNSFVNNKAEKSIDNNINNNSNYNNNNNLVIATTNYGQYNAEPFTLVQCNTPPVFSHSSLLAHPSSAKSTSITVHQAQSNILPLTRAVTVVQGEREATVKTPVTEPSAHVSKNRFVAGKWYEGVVKRYNPQRGYGFITGTCELRVNAMYCDEMCLCNAYKYVQTGNTHCTNEEHDFPLFSPQWQPTKINSAHSSPKVILNLSEVRCEYVEPVETAELSLMQWIVQTADSKGLVKRLEYQEQSIPTKSTYSHIHYNIDDDKNVNLRVNNVEVMKKTSQQHESDRSALMEPLGSIFVHHTSLSIRGFRALEVNSLVRFSVDVVQGTLQTVDVIPLQLHSNSLSSLISATTHLNELTVNTENDVNIVNNDNSNISNNVMFERVKKISNTTLEQEKKEEHQQISTHALLPPPFVITKTAQIVLMNKLAKYNADKQKYKTMENAKIDSSCNANTDKEELDEKQGLNTWSDFVIVPSAAIPSAMIAKSVLEIYRMSQVEAL